MSPNLPRHFAHFQGPHSVVCAIACNVLGHSDLLPIALRLVRFEVSKEDIRGPNRGRPTNDDGDDDSGDEEKTKHWMNHARMATWKVVPAIPLA